MWLIFVVASVTSPAAQNRYAFGLLPKVLDKQYSAHGLVPKQV
jgi:hypothetical protein